MSVKVNVDLKGLERKFSDINMMRGRYAVANQALADMNNYVPALDHFLRNSATIDLSGESVNWNTPYAKAQFHGRVGKGGSPVRNYTTPGTGNRWDLRAKSKHMQDWQRAFVKGAGFD